MTSQIPKEVLRDYQIGKIRSIKPMIAGLVHKTFALTTDRSSFILQKLHPVLASEAIAEDFLAVTEFLRAQEFPTASCVLTKRGRVLARNGKDVWRMQTKLSGRTIHVIESLAMAREAGEIYARFHKVMDEMDYLFKSKKILHETEKVYETFLKVVKGEKVDEVKELADFVRRELPRYFLPTDLPMRVIHGDPKISNILFTKGHAAAIIDLDTCNRRPLLVELGDAFRSWCGGAEDDPHNTFSIPKFRAAWLGYERGARGFITARERALVPKAIGTIILELAVRFLTDYFTDNYFGWDPSRYHSRRAHNLARVRGQLAEFLDYKRKLVQLKKIVESD